MQKGKIVLCDTCVVIDYLKGESLIVEHIQNKIERPCINSIIEMELFQGVLNKRELNKIKKELEIFYEIAHLG